MPTKSGTRFQYTLSDLRECRHILEDVSDECLDVSIKQDHLIMGAEMTAASALVEECLNVIGLFMNRSEFNELLKQASDRHRLISAAVANIVSKAQRQSDAEEMANETSPN